MLLALEGAAVVACARREPEANKRPAWRARREGRRFFVQADVSQADQVARVVRCAVETYGGLNGAFNNAGIEGPGC